MVTNYRFLLIYLYFATCITLSNLMISVSIPCPRRVLISCISGMVTVTLAQWLQTLCHSQLQITFLVKVTLHNGWYNHCILIMMTCMFLFVWHKFAFLFPHIVEKINNFQIFEILCLSFIFKYQIIYINLCLCLTPCDCITLILARTWQIL